MKNLNQILMALAVMFVSVSAFAQTNQGSADATLTVNLADAYNITLGQTAVALSMNTAADFAGGSTSVESDHLQITATGTYTVTVETSSNVFNGPNDGAVASTIGVSNVEVEVTALGTDLNGNSNQTPAFTSSNLSLSTTGQTILTGEPDLERGYDVTYAIPATKTENFLGHDAGAYVTTVTYTLISDE